MNLTFLTSSLPEIIGSNNDRVFGLSLFEADDFVELIVRFSFNLIVTFFLIRFIYYRSTKRKDYVFTYFLISITVFLLCYLLENVKLELGFALGLFAIFGIIRYRTITVPIREMTYLFIIIGLAVINALANKKISYAELIFTNLAILALIYLLERVWFLKHESQKTIIYEKIDLIKPQNHELLIADLEERTGLKINRIDIGELNFLRDSAEITIFYFNGTETNPNKEKL
jgi:hypothetical protein